MEDKWPKSFNFDLIMAMWSFFVVNIGSEEIKKVKYNYDGKITLFFVSSIITKSQKIIHWYNNGNNG